MLEPTLLPPMVGSSGVTKLLVDPEAKLLGVASGRSKNRWEMLGNESLTNVTNVPEFSISGPPSPTKKERKSHYLQHPSPAEKPVLLS